MMMYFGVFSKYNKLSSLTPINPVTTVPPRPLRVWPLAELTSPRVIQDPKETCSLGPVRALDLAN
jgi:hypothetical protein